MITEYGKIVKQNKIEFAPNYYQDRGVTIFSPTEEQHNQHGYYRIINHSPESRKGYLCESHYEYREDLNVIEQVWVYTPAPVRVEDYDAEMEIYITQVRSARGYTTREPSAYINSPNKRFAQDAVDWADFIARVMEYGLNVMNTYAETGVAPTIDEFKAGLPTIKWTYDKEE